MLVAGQAPAQGLDGETKCDCGEVKAAQLLAKQGQKLEDEINTIKAEKTTRLGRIFKMKENLLGGKKVGQEPSAVRDPETEELLVGSKEVKRATLSYCLKNLTNNTMTKEGERLASLKENLHRLRMEEDTMEEFEIGKEECEEVLERFRAKDTKSYDLLLKAGVEYQEQLVNLCRRMIKEETFPEEFQETVLQIIWKGKGPSEVLKNSRFIHLKSFMPRTCEALVVQRMKPAILAASSPYQVGGQPGHSTAEHMFVIMSLMARTKATGEGFIFSLVDLTSFFDREQIVDVMDCLDAVGVSRKAAKCWFKLNQHTRIRVNTAAGMTGEAVAGDLVGQGTAVASLVSQLNLDRGLQQYFAGSEDELYYGKVRVEYAAFQDDIGKPSRGVVEARGHMTKMAYMCEDKGWEAHPSKTCYIMFRGNRKNQEMMERQIEEESIRLGEFVMTRRECDKYLGQHLHQDGAGASVAATVASRAGRFRGAIFEIKSVVEEYGMAAMGPMVAAKTLLESALIPSLLSGSGNWIEMSQRTEDECDNLLCQYWRAMLAVPEGTPKIALFAETGTMRIKWRVWLEKLMLVRRLQEKEKTSLARGVYEEQLRHSWPGLAMEVTRICDEVKLENVNFNKVKKEDIKEAIFMNHYKDLKKELEKYSKLEDIKHEDYRTEKEYMKQKSIEDIRRQFRIRTKLVTTFKDNFRNKFRTLPRGEEDEDPGLRCGDCGAARDTQAHCLVCPAWEAARWGLNFNFLEDLVSYFRTVLEGRERKQEEERARKRMEREEEAREREVLRRGVKRRRG